MLIPRATQRSFSLLLVDARALTNHRKLFVGGISWETTNDGLHNYFAKFGHVVEAQVMRDKMTGRSRGFGFVVLGDEGVADHVCGMQHVLDGRTVRFSPL